MPRPSAHAAVGLVIQPATPTVAVPPVDPLTMIVDSMSVEDKVGQLLFLGFPGGNADAARPAIVELRAGGIALLSNATTADTVRGLTSDLQAIAVAAGMMPLMIAIDHEGEPVQRVRSGVTTFGSNWQLGQVRPLDAAVAAACSRGATHGRELAAMGISMNLGPVLDVWDNPRNRVIAERSFSDDPAMVAELGAAYIQGLQAQGVLAVGKHFPGHGGTDEDSHLTLPVLSSSRARIEAVELLPFRRAIQAQVAGVMTAHVSYPELDPAARRPASLSAAIVTDLLRGQLAYDGLVLTDDMGMMRAITDRYEAGDAAVQAIIAGSDMLIVVGPLERQRRVAEALAAEVGRNISRERLDASVRRILRAKLQARLWGQAPATIAQSASGSCIDR
jgi:beta-N-acetylhexosaminidase